MVEKRSVQKRIRRTLHSNKRRSGSTCECSSDKKSDILTQLMDVNGKKHPISTLSTHTMFSKVLPMTILINEGCVTKKGKLGRSLVI